MNVWTVIDMAKPTDLVALECYRRVLVDLGHITDFIQWKKLPATWLQANLPNVTFKMIHQLMTDHVVAGGEIDQVEETREGYRHWRFHYDLRLPISGRPVYIETVLVQEDDLDDCVIWVVNMKDQ